MKKKVKSNNGTFRNKRVFFDYEITEKIEAGIVLTSTEIKSIRNSKININGSFCIFNGNELYIKGVDIAIYDEGSYLNHDPKRDRKLLLHKKELKRLKAKLEEKGFTIVPIKFYPNENNIYKVEIGLAKGRKNVDKRSYIKDRETKKELREIKI
ncbi:MAG: SsrA-binding protein [bacterium]